MSGKGSGVAVIAVVAAFGLTACGGGSQSSESPSTSTASQPAAQQNPVSKAATARAFARTRETILHFGKEGTAAEREQASATWRGFVAARLSEDWHAACPYLAPATRLMVKQIGGRGDDGCGKGIKAMTVTDTISGGEKKIVEVKSLRQRGDQAFLIYTNGDGKTNAILMRKQDGKWMIDGFNPTPL